MRLGRELLQRHRGGVPVSARTTVLCVAWHRQPGFDDLLRSHAACLDSQTREHERLYVIDGGRPAPAWLRGRAHVLPDAVSFERALRVGLELVETPLVINLNSDDRLYANALAVLELLVDRHGAEVAVGEFLVCYSQADADAAIGQRCRPIPDDLPVPSSWPPRDRQRCRLGSGRPDPSWTQATLGPSVLWRTTIGENARRELPCDNGGARKSDGGAPEVRRAELLVGHYFSHPESQAEFQRGDRPQFATEK